MIDDNTGRESKYKIVREFVERKSRANYYYWQCKLCHKTSGPSALYNILQDRIGTCCKKLVQTALIEEKFKAMEGSILSEYKQLLRYTGRTLDRYPHALFIYACRKCGKEYGPNQLQVIKYHKYTMCCSPGKYEVLGYGVISSARIKYIYSQAAKRKLDCTVTAQYLDQLWHDQNQTCKYTEIKIENIEQASLDRRDSTLGYVPGNVQWVLREVNTMKWNLSEDRFFELCSLVTSRKDTNHE